MPPSPPSCTLRKVCKLIEVMKFISKIYLTPAAEQKHNYSRHGFLAKFGAVIESNLIYSYYNRECGSFCVRPLS